MRPDGKVNLVTLFFLLALAGGLYLLVLFVPLFLDNLDVEEGVRVAYAEARLGKGDETLIARILEKANAPTMGTHKAYDSYGNLIDVPGLGLTRENIVIDRNAVEGTILIRAEYDRTVRLAPTSRVVTVDFRPEAGGPL